MALVIELYIMFNSISDIVKGHYDSHFSPAVGHPHNGQLWIFCMPILPLSMGQIFKFLTIRSTAAYVSPTAEIEPVTLL